MIQRNKKGKFRKFSLGFKIKLAYAKWYETNKYKIAGIVGGALFGSLLSFALFTHYTSPEALQMNNGVKVVEVNATTDKYQERGYAFCYDPIICIRDVGEELGFSNKDISIAIKIAKAESGMNPMSLGKNNNGTFDVGLMQINDVHNKRISRQDRLDYEKNIRFAYQLRKEQGNWNAWSTCHNGKVNCK